MSDHSARRATGTTRRQRLRRRASVFGVLAILAPLVAPASSVSADQLHFIFICKRAAAGSGLTGTFTFTVVDPPDPPVTVQVPVGGCSGRIGVAAPSPQGITIIETPAPGGFVSDITVPSGTVLSPNRLRNGITVALDASTTAASTDGMPTTPGTITFTNDTIRPAGPGDTGHPACRPRRHRRRCDSAVGPGITMLPGLSSGL